MTDILIAGGGLTGLAMAAAAARYGLSITLVDRAPYATQLSPKFDGRVSAVARGSKHVLAHLGAWAGMAPHAEPILDIRVSDRDSPFFMDYRHSEVGEEPFGWIVENRHLRQALADTVAGYDNIRVLAPAAIEKIEADAHGVNVLLSTGEELRARLLIGADGKNSTVRELCGIGEVTSSYGQTAIVCTIAHENPHGGLAQERFLAAGPFAVLPMQNNQSSLVWVEKSEDAPLYLKLPEAEFVQEIAERIGGYLGRLTTVGPRFSYPLSFLHAKSYTAPRVCLIGDAAHAIHPIAGQGVNLGWRDVAVLAEIIEERARLGLDIGSAQALSHYQRWRRFDNTAMLAVTDGLTRLFGVGLPPVKLARGLGLWGVAHLPPLKRFFMRHAMGLTGDLPKMIREAA
jgi:2-octaprenyl-6-methoxyphenol hydroxylase